MFYAVVVKFSLYVGAAHYIFNKLLEGVNDVL